MSLLSQEATTSQGTEGDTRERILDAAGRCVESVGFSRTTLTDVAKTARLSRMTIYRNYASVEAILQDLMTREFNGLVAETIGRARPEPSRLAIVEGVLGALEALTVHPLFMRLLSTDPELLLPYITERPGRFQLHAEDELLRVLKLGIATGEVRREDPKRLAGSMMLAMRGYAFVDKSSWSKRRREQALDDLSLMFERLLAPETAE